MKKLALLLLLATAGCGGPSRTTWARHPGAPAAFDRQALTPEALDIAEKTFAAAGGSAWANAKQIRWKQAIVRDGKVALSGEQAWDRWNMRHWAKTDRGEAGAVGVMYEIYGTYSSGYLESRSGIKQPAATGEVGTVVKVAREAWQRDTSILLAPLLMFEPGAKIEYAGKVKDEAGTELHDLKVTFDPKDPARAGLVLHVYPDPEKFVVKRVELEAGPDRYGYEMTNYQAFGGLQLATERKNVGSGEMVKISNVKVGDVDDDLYTAPLM